MEPTMCLWTARIRYTTDICPTTPGLLNADLMTEQTIPTRASEKRGQQCQESWARSQGPAQGSKGDTVDHLFIQVCERMLGPVRSIRIQGITLAHRQRGICHISQELHLSRPTDFTRWHVDSCQPPGRSRNVASEQASSHLQPGDASVGSVTGRSQQRCGDSGRGLVPIPPIFIIWYGYLMFHFV